MSYFKNNKQMHHVGYDRKGCGGGGGGGGWKKVFCKCLSGGGGKWNVHTFYPTSWN